MGRVLRAALLTLVATGIGCSPGEEPLRVLWVGNSHTYYNDMPAMVSELARAASLKPLENLLETPGGSKLAHHVERGRIPGLLKQRQWDYVVLQEHQQLPSFSPAQRARQVTPYARTLCEQIKRVGSRPLFYMTWARRAGDRMNVRGDTYDRMQERLGVGYAELAQQNGGRVVAVGTAWRAAVARKPDGLVLWHKDGSHASRQGSYLAACVFFKALYQRSPVGNAYTAELAPGVARFLQDIADEAP